MWDNLSTPLFPIRAKRGFHYIDLGLYNDSKLVDFSDFFTAFDHSGRRLLQPFSKLFHDP